MSGEKIMVVEDEWIVADHICEHLRQFGYNASSTTGSGEEVVMMIEKERPDLVLMDIVLHGKTDGIEVADQILTRFDIPVIYLTAHTNGEFIARAKLTKPFGYIVKPFNERELFSNIEVALYKHKWEREIKECKAKLGRTLKGAIDVISETIELKGTYPSGHHQRVARLAAAIAAEMGLSDFQAKGIALAAAVYDIGLLDVPIEVLRDVGRLEGIRLTLYQGHPTKGYNMLKQIEFPWPIADIVLQHRECFDGSGFPAGIKGEDILVEARVLAVADALENLVSQRPYRPSPGIEAALKEIEKNRGILYDDKVVDVCLKLFRDKGFNFEQAASSGDNR